MESTSFFLSDAPAETDAKTIIKVRMRGTPLCFLMAVLLASIISRISLRTPNLLPSLRARFSAPAGGKGGSARLKLTLHGSRLTAGRNAGPRFAVPCRRDREDPWRMDVPSVDC